MWIWLLVSGRLRDTTVQQFSESHFALELDFKIMDIALFRFDGLLEDCWKMSLFLMTYLVIYWSSNLWNLPESKNYYFGKNSPHVTVVSHLYDSLLPSCTLSGYG